MTAPSGVLLMPGQSHPETSPALGAVGSPALGLHSHRESAHSRKESNHAANYRVNETAAAVSAPLDTSVPDVGIRVLSPVAEIPNLVNS